MADKDTVSSYGSQEHGVAIRKNPDGTLSFRHLGSEEQTHELNFNRDEYDAFLKGVKAGEFDIPNKEI